MHERAVTFTDAAGHRIAAILATPDSPCGGLAILCHGFQSTKNSSTNKALTRLLTARGIATLRFDFFGQGESDGPFEAITVTLAAGQADAALRWAEAEGYRDIALVGSSFGGLVALLAAAKAPTIRCLAVKCPVPDFPEVLRLEFGEAGMAEWKQTDTIPDLHGNPGRLALRYALYEDSLRHSGYDAARAITAPTLIVQGDRDALVPLHQSRRLQAALAGPTELEILEGADHGFTAAPHFHRMTGLICDWLLRFLPHTSTPHTSTPIA